MCNCNHKSRQNERACCCNCHGKSNMSKACYQKESSPVKEQQGQSSTGKFVREKNDNQPD